MQKNTTTKVMEQLDIIRNNMFKAGTKLADKFDDDGSVITIRHANQSYRTSIYAMKIQLQNQVIPNKKQSVSKKGKQLSKVA